jgi:hypothetical protein
MVPEAFPFIITNIPYNSFSRESVHIQNLCVQKLTYAKVTHNQSLTLPISQLLAEFLSISLSKANFWGDFAFHNGTPISQDTVRYLNPHCNVTAN